MNKEIKEKLLKDIENFGKYCNGLNENYEEVEEKFDILMSWETEVSKELDGWWMSDLLKLRQKAKELKEEIEKDLFLWENMKSKIEEQPYDEWSLTTESVFEENERDILKCKKNIEKLNKIIGSEE